MQLVITFLLGFSAASVLAYFFHSKIAAEISKLKDQAFALKDKIEARLSAVESALKK